MKRRDFLKVSAVGAAATAVASPAIAQSMPEVKWRMTSSFPKSLDTIYGGAEQVSKYVAEMTDNKFQIQVFAAGEVVPGLQALDATSNNTVEACHTVSYYYVGKDPTFAIYASVPFGLNARQQNSWWYQGGGEALGNEFFKKSANVIGFHCGNTGTQMGGWFRKEIKTVADLSGLKFRIGGIAGQVLQKVGVVPQQLAGGDIYPSLEKGTIDAAEWVGPYDDEKLGFNKVAKFYYYPGWWEGGPALHVLTNQKALAELPADYRAILEAACHEGNTMMMARYDAGNPDALKRLVAGGAQLRPFSRAVMDACYKAALELYKETSDKNPKFKKVHDPYMKFLEDQVLWFRVAEGNFDTFMQTGRRAGGGGGAAAPKKG